MALDITAEPTITAVTLTDAKKQCRITNTAHDDLLVRLVGTASSQVEAITGCILTERSATYYLDTFPDDAIEIPYYPVTAVASIKYDDTDGNEQTLVENTDYYLALVGRTPKIAKADTWPVTLDNKLQAVRITLTLGYAASTDIPEDVKHAILVLVKELFDNGGETVGMDINEVPNTVRSLTAPYRRMMV
jgi:uncharacterized phiE125 gp8 family phage protein